MTIIISALHFAWRSIDECFAQARNDLRLDGVELSFHENRRPFDACMDDLRRSWGPTTPAGLSAGAAADRASSEHPTGRDT